MVFIDNMTQQMENLSAQALTAGIVFSMKSRSEVWQNIFHSYRRSFITIIYIQKHLQGLWFFLLMCLKLISDSSIVIFLCMAYLLLKCLCVSSMLLCMFLIFLQLQMMQLILSDLKQEGELRKEFLIDWNNEQFSLSELKPEGQRAMLPEEQTGVVLSAENQPAVALMCVRVYSL